MSNYYSKKSNDVVADKLAPFAPMANRILKEHNEPDLAAPYLWIQKITQRASEAKILHSGNDNTTEGGDKPSPRVIEVAKKSCFKLLYLRVH